jgi:hypothetical protein
MKRLLLLILLITGAITARAQDQAKPISVQDIKKTADDKKFIFKARRATLKESESRNGNIMSAVPPKLNHNILKEGYYAAMMPDSVVSFLPYYGKTDSEQDSEFITISIEENPTKFSSSEYDYAVKQKKNGDVIITVKPKDATVIEKYIFSLAPDGSAKLELTLTGYRTITYDGTFTAF